MRKGARAHERMARQARRGRIEEIENRVQHSVAEMKMQVLPNFRR
jgi:hypothetical protein